MLAGPWFGDRQSPFLMVSAGKKDIPSAGRVARLLNLQVLGCVVAGAVGGAVPVVAGVPEERDALWDMSPCSPMQNR